MKYNIIRILIVAMSIFMSFACLTSCGEQLNTENDSFTHVHMGDANGYCATVESWCSRTTGVEINTSEYGMIFCSQGTYILFETDACTYC